MSFAELNHRRLIPACEIIMVLGIVALCQPWVEFLHRYGVTIVLLGLIGFSVLTKFKAPVEKPDEEHA